MIDFNKLTDYTQQIVLDSQKIMQKYQNSQIEPVHILFAMQEDRESVSGNFLKELGNDKNERSTLEFNRCFFSFKHL